MSPIVGKRYKCKNCYDEGVVSIGGGKGEWSSISRSGTDRSRDPEYSFLIVWIVKELIRKKRTWTDCLRWFTKLASHSLRCLTWRVGTFEVAENVIPH
ncbi:hypothetical protein FRX31_002866 [Thalictrum thalictroides]|uniref:Uncharacterized protein n=1 Tax=Thalictrum thalictroides TaxID=46969 RepID=A0A7J6XFB3_THATH|nr:hypothetical protein FRX31_002866 [Thalictrum thalictroides]